MSELRVIEAAGRPYELGVEVGKKCKGEIQAYLDFMLGVILEGSLSRPERGKPMTKDVALEKGMRFLPFFERYAAGLLEEVKGLAEGAGISFKEALLLQIRDQVLNLQHEDCTTFAFSGDATKDGSTLTGQNSDMPPVYKDFLMLYVLRPENSPGAAMMTFPGQMGYHGFNSVGIGQFANALRGPAWQMGLSHYPFKRILLQQTTLEGCIQAFKDIPLSSGGNYMIAEQGGRAMDVEVLPGADFDIIEMGKGAHVHTNNILSKRFISHEKAPLVDSPKRLARAKSLVASSMGHINVETVKKMLQDHEGYPTSICRHLGNQDSVTIFSIIAQPEIGVAHIAVGNPCTNPYKVYEIFGQ